MSSKTTYGVIIFLVLVLIVGFFVAKSFLPGSTFSKAPKVHENSYECLNDDTINSRGYVYIHGLGDHNPGMLTNIQEGLDADPKSGDLLDFDYDETKSLIELSEEFTISFNEYASSNNFDEIIIISQSAGGIISSHAAYKLDPNVPIELHTMASPLKGYHVSDKYLGELTGFGKEIGLGINSYETPKENIKAFHHKTIDDEELSSYCGEYAKFCDSLKVQNNNLQGSSDYYYPGETHESIMPVVSKVVFECQR